LAPAFTVSTNLISSGTTAREKMNLRTPEVMLAVQEQVESHYRSDIVDKVRRAGGILRFGEVTVRLAKQFGFCYGVERAIDLAYAARKVFKDRRLFIVGEIIHNPEVNDQISSLGIRNLMGKNKEADIADLRPEDVVIVPAFGTELSTLQQIKERGCQIVDTTCGDVMSVWKRVRKYASESATSIIHGKAEHEETKATSSRALGDGSGHYLVVLTLPDTDYVCDYIRHGGDKHAFMEKFRNAHSPGFDPDLHLKTVGVANQTTMLRGETEEVQRRIRQAIVDRDGPELAATNFRFFDTICGATQERQDALRELLDVRMNLLLVVGGYNSSNTSHLAEMGEEKLPTYFVRNASRLLSEKEILHYDLKARQEVIAKDWLPGGPIVVGITAGASCPNNLIEETLVRLFELRGIRREELEAAA
jgi:4-hydroxy-3-methylbut-2-en-1-yl diphosphate reductase